MAYLFQEQVGGRTLTFEVGDLAAQANGSVVVRYGDVVILSTVCMAPEPRVGVDFLPLTVDFEERMYAVGKIPGSFFRREGRPSQEAILSARLIDRSLRPLFPKGFANDLQVVLTVLSVDRENLPDVLSISAASAALHISEIPFAGPVGACRVGYLDGQIVINPTYTQLQESTIDLVIASTREAIVMVEAGAREAPESLILEAIDAGHRANQTVIQLTEEAARKVGRAKIPVSEPAVSAQVSEAVASLLDNRLRGLPPQDIDKLRKEAVAQLSERFSESEVGKAFDALHKAEVRRQIVAQGLRPDGRGLKEIRPVKAQVGLLPRTHGSGLFQRGQTQVLTIATLASLGEQQKLDTLNPEESKRFIHHYNFPPFSTGEVKRIGSPARREIGHGALAERALMPVIPNEEEFPYTIRLVSEVLSSNGSTSMASVCGSTLALMDAGVPIKAPVAGIAMGLAMGEGGKYAVLTDIQGLEDHLGDMDFKVAGTSKGITALQMDIKVQGINQTILKEALVQAQEARLFILEKMREAIPEVRPIMSQYAPRVYRIKIPREKIGAVIGPGGKTIRSIIEAHKVTIDVEDDGTVLIGSPNEEAARKAIETVEGLVQEAKVGATYTGKVTRITSFGAFVEIFPGKEGLLRLGEIADRPITRVEDELNLGDEVTVMVAEIDHLGRINLSRRAVLQGLSPADVPKGRPERELPREGFLGGRRFPGFRPPSGPPRYPPRGPERGPQGPQRGDRSSPWQGGSRGGESRGSSTGGSTIERSPVQRPEEDTREQR
ncbi:MAG: polyribonucleotide nucleotidyltransferase [Chloroflexi bacterium]|nr:polyribonucleotide nucleotidyltransferase [Chloroflexota bacterium]